MSNYRVIVLTCDSYLPYLKPFIHQFNTYWGKDQQVLVAGFNPPDFEMPRNFRFHSVGKAENYPIKKWSDAFIDLLNQVQDDVFVFALEDYWITDKVDVRGVQLLVDYARRNSKIVRIDLTPDRLHTMENAYPDFDHKGEQLEHLKLVKSISGAPYSLSVIFSVFSRYNLLKVLERGWDPWQVEMQGSYKVYLQGDEMEVYGTESIPVPHCVGIRKLPEGNGKLWLETGFFKEEDRKKMQELGILGETGFF